MTGRERFFAGILGALMPICAIVLTLDISSIFSEESGLSTGHIIGITIQFVIFLFVGGTVAYMHSDEVKAYKLFQIGMATPALLASFTTSNGLNSALHSSAESTAPTSVESSIPSGSSFSFNLIPSAHASDNPLDMVETQEFAMDGGSIGSQIYQGITGGWTKTVKDNKKKNTPTKKESKKIIAPKKPANTSSAPASINNRVVGTAAPARPVAIEAPRMEAATTRASATASASSAAEVTVGTESRVEAPAMLMTVEESAAELPAIRLESIEPAAGAAATTSSNENNRYQQLLLRLQELENMQRQIREEMQSLSPAG